MTDTFTWDHVSEPSGTITFSVLSAQFGDGYSQRLANGINNESGSWPLSFVGDDDFIGAIVAFIRAHKGAQSFYWTPPVPNGEQGLYVATSYNPVPYGDGQYQLSVTFQQVFMP